MKELQREIGIPQSGKGEHTAVRLKMNYCMADCMESAIVFTPEGVFNNCEHLPDGHSWGNIFDGVTDQAKYDALCAALPLDEKCAKCPFLPECTPFYKNGCPGWFEKCCEYNSMRTEYMLHCLLSGENVEADDDDEESYGG
ncbi:MAG: hypothetical protein K5695_16370 [Oscillospiraceae bacterium]|nr:hypothetical protein [Oscillospiraceae bacterium]